MERHDVAHHLDALVEGAVLVVLGERVLLQVVVLDEPEGGRVYILTLNRFINPRPPPAGGAPCRLQCDLVGLGQGILAHQLHDLIQLVLLLQHLAEHRAQGNKLGVESVGGGQGRGEGSDG